MGRAKFSLNALLLIITIFSAILFFITVILFDMRDYSFLYVDEYTPIEGSDYNARFSTREENGIYKGPYGNATLIAPGQFAANFGTALIDDTLYITEYKMTRLNLAVFDVIGIDLTNGDQYIILEDSIVRGRCKSGEIVCISGIIAPAAHPETNSLCRLYSLSSSDIKPEEAGGSIAFLDPDTLDTVYETHADNVFHNKFAAFYLDRSLDEIKKSDLTAQEKTGIAAPAIPPIDAFDSEVLS